jgi:hypothetical protein
MAGERPAALRAPASWAIFKKSPGLVLGFHGCDRSTGDALFSGAQRHIKQSTNAYDWLGTGTYFWESDPWRALAFANQAKMNKHLTKGRIENPYVVGAVIDLGLCCNLLESSALGEVKEAYDYLDAVDKLVGDQSMPQNKGAELGLRFLDKAVIDVVHKQRERRGIEKYDSVRAAFIEGDLLYPKAGFSSKNHIQIAVLNPSCIKGYFRLPGL